MIRVGEKNSSTHGEICETFEKALMLRDTSLTKEDASKDSCESEGIRPRFEAEKENRSKEHEHDLYDGRLEQNQTQCRLFCERHTHAST